MATGSVRIDLLNKTNYESWVVHAEALLIKSDAWGYVTGMLPKPVDSEAARLWMSNDSKARADLILSMSASELRHVRGCATSKEVWDKLKSIYASKGPARKATLLKQLTMAKSEDDDDVEEHVMKFFDIKDKLNAMNVDIHSDLFSIMLLYSLPASFENFRCAIESRDVIPDPEALKIKILEESCSRHQPKTDRAMIAKGKSEKKKSTEKPKGFMFKCFKCHKLGHKASECLKKGDAKRVSNKCDSDVHRAVFNTGFENFNCVSDECRAVHGGKENWILDSGCTSHLCNDASKFVNGMIPASGKLNLASNSTTNVQGKGVVTLSACKDESKTVVSLSDTLFVPDLRSNLISVAKITDKGSVVTFSQNKAVVTNSQGEVQFFADRLGSLYYVREKTDSVSVVTNSDAWRWHERLGHLNAKDLSKVLVRSGIKTGSIDNREFHDCDICAKGKMSALPFSRTSGPCDDILKIVYSDVVGPMQTEALGGAKYFVTFIDDCTRWCEVFLLTKKNDVFMFFKTYKNFVENLTGKKIKYLQTDNGGEYCNRDFDVFLKNEGISRRLTAPRTPQQNGVAERMNRTLVEMARCMLISSGLSPSFWADAVVTACHVRNRCPSSSLGGQIPYEKWYGKPVQLHYFQKFGSKSYVLDKEQKGKFAARSVEGVFVGYPRNAKGYRVWIPQDRKVVISRDVRFHEHETSTKNLEIDPFKTDQPHSGIKVDEPKYIEKPKVAEIEIISKVHLENQSNNMGPDGEHPTSPPEAEPLTELRMDAGPSHHGAGSGDFGTRSVEEDSTHHEEVQERVMKRGPGRPRVDRSGVGRPRKVYRMVEVEPDIQIEEEIDDFVDCDDFVGAAELSLKEVLSGNERYGWEQAIMSEVKSLLKNETWDIVKKPANRTVVGCRYVLTTKVNVDKTEKKKARLVAQGFSQRYGVDYHNTFAPVARLDTVRLLTALAVELDMEIHQLDVSTAYLNGFLDEEIYMKIPQLLKDCLQKLVNLGDEDFALKIKAKKMLEDLELGGDVCRLKKSLYGLKQAGRQWNILLDEKLRKMKLKPTVNEPCLYFKDIDEHGTKIFVVIYVDDILIACSQRGCIENFKRELSKEFELKDFGLASYVLGIDIVKKGNVIKLSQQKYVNDLLKKFNMVDCKETVSTPMEVGQKFGIENGEECGKDEAEWPYRELIGSLLYLATGTRPDIANSVVRLAQFANTPNITCWKAAKRLLRYLKRTQEYGLVFKKTEKSVVGFSDADWGNCLLDRCSYSGYAFILGGACISWKSQKQKSVATSTCEAEYVSLSQGMKEAVYLHSLLTEIELHRYAKISLHADNQGAISLAKDPVFHSRCKHIDIRCHFIRNVLRYNKNIELKYVSTNNMLADVLTKPLPKQAHYMCALGLGLHQQG